MNLDGFIHAIDGVDFARRRLGFNPDAKQSLVLGKRVRRGLLNWSFAGRAGRCGPNAPTNLQTTAPLRPFAPALFRKVPNPDLPA